MKNTSVSAFPSITGSKKTAGLRAKRSNKTIPSHKIPDPPSEETIDRMNAIVKQAPFCYYYKENRIEFL